MTIESPPDSGIHKSEIIERQYYGDVLQRNLHYQESQTIIENMNLNNEISIVADNFILKNAYAMRYVVYLGTKWSIRTISVDYPRITFTFGGVYNGENGPRQKT